MFDPFRQLQANCDKMSPTPRPENPRAASFNPRAASFNPRGPLEPTTFPPTVKKQDSNSSLLEQASGVTFNGKKQKFYSQLLSSLN